ncbi:unnamed protein product [Taenia asiatica]|uniref:UBZ4-type domain-containing protein n=1 Tax=Taenia asiatica TaxID=60517 RepID=A0A0R3WAC1_TAEAS|nr:unnamed protein product [Taenia asiatica]
MDESEFVVVDEDHKESAGFDNLAEVVQAYGAARDSLLKGVTLLHDTLNLTMELALKNTPPDFESNSDDLMKRILGSLHTSSEAVLRNHVKSLCSKLVAVKKEYEDLANKLGNPNVQGSPESSSKFARLVGVFDQIDALLPPSGAAAAAGPSNAAPTSDVEDLCVRAESIRDRVKLVMEARLGPASGAPLLRAFVVPDGTGLPHYFDYLLQLRLFGVARPFARLPTHAPLDQPEQRGRKGIGFYDHFPVIFVLTSNALALYFLMQIWRQILPNSRVFHRQRRRRIWILNLIRKTSSEVSLYRSQYPQHAVSPSHYYHRLQQYQQYRHQSHHVDCEKQSHQLPLQPAATATYRHGPHIVSSARHSFVIDDDLRLPIGHVQRLKKKLSASLNASGLDRVPSDLRAIPRQIPGAKELFGTSTIPPNHTILPSSAAKPPSLPTQRQLPPPAPRRQSTKDEIVSLQKNVASLAAAAALQRNVSVRAKEVIIDGCGGGGGNSSSRGLAVSRSVAVGFVPPLLPKPSVSVQTQTEPFGACPWWMMLEAPGWRQSSMSFSATSSGIGMDDGSNFQDDLSSVSRTCFVCCKHSAAVAGAGGTNRPHSGTNSFYPAPDLLQEISRMIREEVTSVFQSEMGTILERQRDLIQQVLKPLAEGKQTVEHARRPPDDFHASAEGDKSHSASSFQKLATAPSSHLGPHADENAIAEEHREISTQPPFQTSIDASSSVTQPMEEPICPKCQMLLPDRGALELHLDQCLQ